MKDNKGISLVEMIVTIAVLAIVATTLASIIGMALKFYSSEHADTSLQYEAQLALNTTTDNIMQATGIAIWGEDEYTTLDGQVRAFPITKQLCLGQFIKDGAGYRYNGIVIFGEPGTGTGGSMNLYIAQYPDSVATPAPTDSTTPDSTATPEIPGVPLAATTIEGAMAELRTKFASDTNTEATKKAALLAQNVEYFHAKPSDSKLFTLHNDTDGTDEYYFESPLSIDVRIVLAARTQKGIERQTLEDTIMLRNNIEQVYFQHELKEKE